MIPMVTGTISPRMDTADSLATTEAHPIMEVVTGIRPQAHTTAVSARDLSENASDWRMNVVGLKRRGDVRSSSRLPCTDLRERSDVRLASVPVNRSAREKSDSVDVVICGYRAVWDVSRAK